MKILDEGHKYELKVLDGNETQILTFVKRCDLNNPKRFPGNTNSYCGTTIQNVLRALLNRFRYLQNQIWCFENLIIISLLKISLWLIEFRAARRHNKFYLHTLKYAEVTPMCNICLHTDCKHIRKEYDKRTRDGKRVPPKVWCDYK